MLQEPWKLQKWSIVLDRRFTFTFYSFWLSMSLHTQIFVDWGLSELPLIRVLKEIRSVNINSTEKYNIISHQTPIRNPFDENTDYPISADASNPKQKNSKCRSIQEDYQVETLWTCLKCCLRWSFLANLFWALRQSEKRQPYLFTPECDSWWRCSSYGLL